MKFEYSMKGEIERETERKSLWVEYRRRRSVPLRPWPSLALAILLLFWSLAVWLRGAIEVGDAG